jgi:DNA gyrase subunit B
MSNSAIRTQRDQDIVQINPLDHVRKRPNLYLGGTDSAALHHMIYEVVDQSINLAFEGQCDHIWVTLRADNVVSIRDNGPGLSPIVDKHGRSELEIYMTEVGMCGRYVPDAHEYHVSGGVHGVGITAVNGLSEWMSVEVARDGFLWKQEYRAGVVQDQVMPIRPLQADVETSMSFTFRPDFSIFEANHFSYEELSQRFQSISYLVKGLAITLRDERVIPYAETVFRSDNGLLDYIKQMNADVETLHEPIYEQFEVRVPRQHSEPYTIEVDFALQYNGTTECKMLSFVNTVEITDGGDHIQAVKSAITNVINGKTQFRTSDKVGDYSPQEVTPGLTMVMHILHPDPSFESYMKMKLLVAAELYGGISEAAFRAGIQLLQESRTIIQLTEKLEDNRFVLKGGVC